VPYATASDVSSRLGRPLTEDESTQTTAQLVDAEILLKERISDLDDQAEDDDYLEKVIMVEANAVRVCCGTPRDTPEKRTAITRIRSTGAWLPVLWR
jgi:hypothetical protein